MNFVKLTYSRARDFHPWTTNNKLTASVLLVLVSSIAAAATTHVQHLADQRAAERLYEIVNDKYGFKMSYDGIFELNRWNDRALSLRSARGSISLYVNDITDLKYLNDNSDINAFIRFRSKPGSLEEQITFAHVSGIMVTERRTGLERYMSKTFYFARDNNIFEIGVWYFLDVGAPEWDEFGNVLNSFEFTRPPAAT